MNLSTVSLVPGRVVIDVQGTTLTPDDVARLRHPATGGVILFARNFESRAQLSGLVAAIHALRSEPLLVAVDHEGGRVQRFRADGFTPLPPMHALGQLWDRDPQEALRSAVEVGYVLAAELRSCGVDLSFTPVLDLDYGRSQVIGSRAFHRHPAAVADLARALVHGLHLGGMAACGKHFPGHGYVEADSHHAVPVDERPLDAILAEDAAPYHWLGDLTLPSVMPAHVIYPLADARPAGFSPFWITTILRERLRYDGLVFSDDLTMEGAAVAGDIVARAHAALDAGCYMVLVCNRPDLADQVLQALEGGMPTASLARWRRLRPCGPAPDWHELQASEAYRRARATALRLNA